VEDPPLTEFGRRQAECLAEWIRPVGLTRLITSPFRRALETTDFIKKATRLTPEVWVDLYEQGGCVSGTDTTSYTGRPGMARTEIVTAFPGYLLPDEIDEQGWWKCRPLEEMEEAEVRAESVARQTIRRFAHTEERVAFVSHGTFLRILIGVLFGVSVLERDWLGGILNTAVTKVLLTPDHTRLDSFNAVGHLPEGCIS
jgi:broad specificity phosphatase PhoE